MIALLASLLFQCPDGTPPPCSRAAPVSARSVAVHNFRLLSRDSSDAYLAEGLADAVTSRLSQIERLEVASRTAARLGRAPRAAFVVSGTMLRQNRRLVVNVELLRAATGRNAWAQRYDRPDTAVLDLEREIAVGVASAMLPSVTPAERQALGIGRAENPEAYDRLLRGDFLLARRNPTSTAQAIREYEAAVRLEPTMASAHARIALASAIWFDWEWTPDASAPPESILTKGIAAAERAILLDSMSSDAWVAWAYVRSWSRPRTMDGVEAAFRRAIALDPRNAEAHAQYGDWLGAMERGAESDSAQRRALAIDPLRTVTLRNLGGIELLDSAVRLQPDHYYNYILRGWTRLQSGDTAGARADAETARRLQPPENRVVGLADYAQQRMAFGDSAAARAIVDSAWALLPATGPLGLRSLALGRALFEAGDMDRALTVLERARPRGAVMWFGVMDNETDLTRLPERARAVLEEARPPWVR